MFIAAGKREVSTTDSLTHWVNDVSLSCMISTLKDVLWTVRGHGLVLDSLHSGFPEEVLQFTARVYAASGKQ
jgi:hypothetical protein